MATVSIILREYEGENGLRQVAFVIRNRGTHAYIDSGVKIPEKFWDKSTHIKKGAPGIKNHIFANTTFPKINRH